MNAPTIVLCRSCHNKIERQLVIEEKALGFDRTAPAGSRPDTLFFYVILTRFLGKWRAYPTLYQYLPFSERKKVYGILEKEEKQKR